VPESPRCDCVPPELTADALGIGRRSRQNQLGIPINSWLIAAFSNHRAGSHRPSKPPADPLSAS